MLTDLQKKTAQAVVTIFETSRLLGANAYSQVTLLEGDTGGLTYGREQTTLMSGNLYLLIKDYVDNNGAHALPFRRYLDRMMACDATLNRDRALHDLLRTAGQDPIMHAVQDAFFDRVYWMPAQRHAESLHLAYPLSWSVVYDSVIHGSFPRLKKQVTDMLGVPTDVASEIKWINTYLATRRKWLANHSNPLLRKCVYRQDEYFKQIAANKWMLDLPMTVRGVHITENEVLAHGAIPMPYLDFNDPPPASAKDGSDVRRLLFYKSPPLIGPDVVAVQQVLVQLGYPLVPDGVFGSNTVQAVTLFQQSRGLKADGIVGQSTRAALGIL